MFQIVTSISNQLKTYKNSFLALKVAVAAFGYLFSHISFATVLITLFLIFLIRFFIGSPDGDVILSFCEKFGKSSDTLKGNVIWITGSSTGIGEALAYELAKRRVKLALSARSEDKLENVKKRCIEIGLNSNDVLVVPFDMTDLSKHDVAFSTVLKHFGKLDVLVSNAGRGQMALWEDIGLEVDKALFDLNVFSLLKLARIVTKHFISVGGGRHVVMSSAAAIIGNPNASTYSASKFALNGYFDTLRLERGKIIKINVLCPGPVESKIMDGLLYETLDKSAKAIKRTVTLMSAERCAELSAIAIANDVKEAWISNCPVLIFMYIFQYFPALTKWLSHQFDMMKVFTVKELKE